MKKLTKYIVILVLALLGCNQTKAQTEVVLGTVRYDGFNNITKGAFWSTRPEAKMVYNGGYPPGVEVIVLDKDYYVRFIDSEHNSGDKNYIIFPKGEKVYTKNGNYYAAVCGNQIEYLRPVDQVKIIQEKPVVPTVTYANVVIRDTTYEIVKVKKEVEEEEEKPQERSYKGGPSCNCEPVYENRRVYDERRRTYVMVRINVNANMQRRQQPYYAPQQTIRTMPQGIPANGNPGGGGIPAGRRTMPRGTPYRGY